MITRVDERLRREADFFSLRFGCESCVAFDPATQGCAHLYPNDDHRGITLAEVDHVVFCKEFEIG